MIRMDIYDGPTPDQLRMADLCGQLRACAAMLDQLGDLAQHCAAPALEEFAAAFTGEDT